MGNQEDKLKILEKIKKRTDAKVIISTEKKKNQLFYIDAIEGIGLLPDIIETKVGGEIKKIAVSSIIKIKEHKTQKILYPKPDVK